MNRKTLMKFIEKLGNYNKRTNILIKGSGALFLNKSISREPNDIDITIDSDMTPEETEKIWSNIIKDFIQIKIVADNDLIKSSILGWNNKIIQLEWVTKGWIGSNSYNVIYKNIFALKNEWVLYTKFSQIGSYIAEKRNQIANTRDKFIIVFNDTENLISNEIIYNEFKDKINYIISDMLPSTLFANFSSSVNVLSIPFDRDFNVVMKRISNDTYKFNDKTIQRLKEINENISPQTHNKLTVVREMIKMKYELMKPFKELNNDDKSKFKYNLNSITFTNKKEIEKVITCLIEVLVVKLKKKKTKIVFEWQKSSNILISGLKSADSKILLKYRTIDNKFKTTYEIIWLCIAEYLFA